MWNSRNTAAEKAAEEAQSSNTRTSPFRTASQSSRPSFSTGLTGSRFAPVRGKRQTSQLGRSISILPNPLNPFDQLEICTWNNPHDGLLGLASLKEVIKPCCERVFCFQAESDSSWASWSTWSGCTQSCGTGVRQRSRDCLRDGIVVETDRCKGNDIEQSNCNNNACPYMKSWSQWSSCSTSCGQGAQTRTRDCSSAMGCGDQPSYETRPCSSGGCLSNWSNWTDCDKPCGNGRQSRNRYCLDYEVACNGQLEEAKTCNSSPCEQWSDYAPVGQCQNSRMCGKGMQVYQRECVPSQLTVANDCSTYANCNPGALGCSGSDSMTRDCDLAPCPSWSAWAEWSNCEGNKKSRNRICMNGVDCPGSDIQEESCWGGWSSNSGSNSQWGRTTDNWRPWSMWSGCSGGQQYRQRTCQQYGACMGSATEYKNCASGWGFSNPAFQNSMFGSLFGRRR
jgi:hypothetical protein